MLCAIVTAGFACQWIAWRIKLPSIVFLLFTGILVGPLLNWLKPDEFLGDLLVPLVSIAVAIILFEGSLTLKFKDIRNHGLVVQNLVTVGILLTCLSAAASAYWLLEWDLSMSILFGAIVSVSGPTVVTPLLRTLRLNTTLSNILRWEGILIDALGTILALVVFNFIMATYVTEGIFEALQTLLIIILAGTFLGCSGGYALGTAIRRRLIPDFLRDYAALAAVLSVFAAAEFIQSEAGLLAVTIMGIWLANMRNVELTDVLSFKESLTLLLVSGLFIVLAARLNLEGIKALGISALMVLAALQLVAGPLRSLACTIGSTLSWKERIFLGWVFPRGIVAAAISALFALRLQESGRIEAESLVPMVFTIILGTVIIQSLSARLIAGWLGVRDPEPTGFLIVGSNPVSLTYAKALKDSGRRVLLASSDWDRTSTARMMGLPVFYGSVVSSYAEKNLDLTGIGSLLALSREPSMNELACVRFVREFGRAHVYTLHRELESTHEKYKVSGESHGRLLFGGERSIDELLEYINSGADIKTTELSETFNYKDYLNKHAEQIILFATDPNGEIYLQVSDEEFIPKSGWKITALIQPGLSQGELSQESINQGNSD